MIPYIQLLTLPTGPHNPHTLSSHHLIHANKSFTRDQLELERGITLGRGGSKEAKKVEEIARRCVEIGEEGVEDVEHGRYHTKVASRVHARLHIKNRQLLLSDLGSVNGTFILWSPVTSTFESMEGEEAYRLREGKFVPVKDRDIITLGDSAKTDPANRREHQPIRARVIFSDQAKADLDGVVNDPTDREVNVDVVNLTETSHSTEINKTSGRYSLQFEESDDEEGYTTESPRKVGIPLDDSSDGVVEVHTPIKDQVHLEINADANVWASDGNNDDDHDHDDGGNMLPSFFIPADIIDKPLLNHDVENQDERLFPWSSSQSDGSGNSLQDQDQIEQPRSSAPEVHRDRQDHGILLGDLELPADFWNVESVDEPVLPAILATSPMMPVMPTTPEMASTTALTAAEDDGNDGDDGEDDPQFLRMSQRANGDARSPYQVSDDEDDDEEEEVEEKDEREDDDSDDDAATSQSDCDIYRKLPVLVDSISDSEEKDEDDSSDGSEISAPERVQISDGPTRQPVNGSRLWSRNSNWSAASLDGSSLRPGNRSRLWSDSENRNFAGMGRTALEFHGNRLLPVNKTSVGATVGSESGSEAGLEGTEAGLNGPLIYRDSIQDYLMPYFDTEEPAAPVTAFADLLATPPVAIATTTGSKRKATSEDDEAVSTPVETAPIGKGEVPIKASNKRRKLDGRDMTMLSAGMAIGATGIVAALLYAA